MTGVITIEVPVVANGSNGVSVPIEIPSGMTLVGVDVPEMTSTSFTISHANAVAGTYKTLSDPLGIISSAGTAITFTMGSTSIGLWDIPPIVVASLNAWIKLTFSSNETAGIKLLFRYIS